MQSQLMKIFHSSFLFQLVLAVAFLTAGGVVNPAAAQTTVLFDFEEAPGEGAIDPVFVDSATGFTLTHTPGVVRGNAQWANDGDKCFPKTGDGCMRLSDLGVGQTPVTVTINFSEPVDAVSLFATRDAAATITPIVESGVLAPTSVDLGYDQYEFSGDGPYIGLLMQSDTVNNLMWDDLEVTFGSIEFQRGDLLGAESETGNLLVVDPADGMGSVIGNTEIVPFTALAKDPTSGILYGAGQELNPPMLFRYQTIVLLEDQEEGSVPDGIDTLIIDWITTKNSGPVGVDDLTYLSIVMLDGATDRFIDVAIIDGEVQEISGVERVLEDLVFGFDHESNELSQLRNVTDEVLQPEECEVCPSGTAYQVEDGVTIQIDGELRFEKVIDGDSTGFGIGLVTFQLTNLLRIEGTPLLVEIDQTTGQQTTVSVVGPDIISVNGADFDADGQLWASVTVADDCEGECGEIDALAMIDKSDGSATVIGFGFGADCIDGISFDKAGTLWGISSCTDNLYQIDTEGGAAEFVTRTHMGEGGPIPADGFHSLQWSCVSQGEGGQEERLYGGLGEQEGDGGFLYTILADGGFSSPVGESSATDGSSLGGLALHTTCGNNVSNTPTPEGENVTVISVPVFEQVAANVVQAGSTDASFCVLPDIRYVGDTFTARNLSISEMAGMGSCTGPLVPGGAETWETDIFPKLNLVIASWYRSYPGEFTLPGDDMPTDGYWLVLGVVQSTAEFDGPVTYISFPETLIDYSDVPEMQTPGCDRPLAWRNLDIAGAVPEFGDFPNFEGNRMIVETAQCNTARSMTRRTTHIYPMRYSYPKAGARAEAMNITAQIAGISGTLREAAVCADPSLLADMQASLQTAQLAHKANSFAAAEEAFEAIARSAKNAESFGSGFASCPVERNYRGNFMSRGITAAFTTHDRFEHAGAYVKYFLPADLDIPLLDSEVD